MPTIHNIDSTITGQVIRLDNGGLAIGVLRSGIQRLVTVGGEIFLVDSRQILDQPAICARCHRSDWIQGDRDSMCMRCAPASADERCAIWSAAHAWFERGRVNMAHALDRCLVEGWCWSQVGQAAFSARTVSLIVELARPRRATMTPSDRSLAHLRALGSLRLNDPINGHRAICAGLGRGINHAASLMQDGTRDVDRAALSSVAVQNLAVRIPDAVVLDRL